MTEYNDPTPISPLEPEYDANNVDPRVKNYSDQVRTKMFGKAVRESLARGIDIASIVANEAKVSAEEAVTITQQLIDGTFDDAELSTAIESRLNQLEQDYAPTLTAIENEVTDARGDESTLGAKISNITSQLVQKVKKGDIFVRLADFGGVNDGVTDNTQALLDAEAALPNGGTILFNNGTWFFNSSINPKANVFYVGTGLGTILKFADGISGFKSLEPKFNVAIRDMKLQGAGVLNSLANGIELNGQGTGFPKLNISNVQISSFGGIGMFLERCWDVKIEKVNASANHGHGFHFISCNSIDANIIAFSNKGMGIFIQSMQAGRISGTSQANELTGIRIEHVVASTIKLYLENNGFNGSDNEGKSQMVIGQRTNYGASSGNEITVLCLGGKNDADTTKGSTYGVYCNVGYNNLINGNFSGHKTSNLYFTSLSKNNKIGAVEHVTGLPNGDTPTKVTDNGTMNGYMVVSNQENTRIETLSSASQTTPRTVTFAKPFTVAPRVVGNVTSSIDATVNSVKISNITTTGFDFVVNGSDGSHTAGKQCHFIAIGQ